MYSFGAATWSERYSPGACCKRPRPRRQWRSLFDAEAQEVGEGRMNSNAALMLACVVCWLCNPPFGTAAFYYASKPSSDESPNPMCSSRLYTLTLAVTRHSERPLSTTPVSRPQTSRQTPMCSSRLYTLTLAITRHSERPLSTTPVSCPQTSRQTPMCSCRLYTLTLAITRHSERPLSTIRQ